MTEFEKAMVALHGAQFELLAMMAQRHASNVADVERIKVLRGEVNDMFDRLLPYIRRV